MKVIKKEAFSFYLFHEEDKRVIIKATDQTDFDYKLSLFKAGDYHHSIYYNNSLNPLEIVFVYSGMGSEWTGMGQELYLKCNRFRDAIDKIDLLMKAYSSWSLVEELMKATKYNRITRAKFAQLANFALQYGLTEIWQNYGVNPSVVIGHSYGEIMAFYKSGILSIQDAIRIACIRGELQEQLDGGGKMLAVNDSIKNINSYNYQGISVAAINSFSSFVLSGDSDVLNKIYEESPGSCRFLTMSVPYHSYLLKDIDQECFNTLKDIEYMPPKITTYSTVTGRKINIDNIPSRHLFQNSQQTVLFNDAINSIINDGYNTFIEIGAHPVLVKYLNEIAHRAGKKCNIFYTLRKQSDSFHSIEDSLCQLYCAGANVHLEKQQ
jgi:acyl transferase domain-containing protein